MEDDEKLFILTDDGIRKTWSVKRLWELAERLEIFDYPVSSFEAFDEDCWFGDRHKPTIRKVLEHSQRISDADLSYPVIISEDGRIIDGIHRICKAYLKNQKTLKAVKFPKDPEPDKIEKE